MSYKLAIIHRPALLISCGTIRVSLLTCYHGTTQNDRLLVFAERYYPEQKLEEKVEVKPDADEYSYLSKVDLKVKFWYEKPQTFVIGALGILLFLFIYTFISQRKH